MEKIIDLRKSVYELCKDNPEIMDIMRELGFDNITTPGMLNTAGRFMTIPKGAKMKRIGLEHVIGVFRDKGYAVTQ